MFRVAGQVVGFDEQGNITLNGRVPAQLIELGNGMFKVVGFFRRYVKPQKVVGARKRKQALKASTKRYCFSFTYRKEM